MAKMIGFIGGGQMAEALIKGLVESGKAAPSQLLVVEPDKNRQDLLQKKYKVTLSSSLPELIDQMEIIILAVKPQIINSVLHELRPLFSTQLLVSVAAGVPISSYCSLLGTDSVRFIRVMPNMGALLLEGATALCRNQHVSDDELSLVEDLFSAVGTTVVVEEKLMDGVTGLSGSGPAYVFSFIEALIDGGIKVGLSSEAARKLTVQTVLGAAKLMQESEEHPAALRARVASPGGTTISGLHVLEKSGFHGTVMAAVEEAYKRSIELGKS